VTTYAVNDSCYFVRAEGLGYPKCSWINWL